MLCCSVLVTEFYSLLSDPRHWEEDEASVGADQLPDVQPIGNEWAFKEVRANNRQFEINKDFLKCGF